MMQHLYSFFTMGCLLALLKIEKLQKTIITSILFICSCLLIISFYFDIFKYTHYTLLPIICVSFGISSWKYIDQLGNKMGDLSYGIYIFGFPVQQMIEYFLAPTPLEMMLYTFPVVIFISYFSWHYIEKPLLKFKKILKFERETD